MIKIAMCIRNRLGSTKKSIESLYKHTSGPFQLYIYDNLTNYRLEEHFAYYQQLFIDKKITQLTFNTEESTHGAFSKASSLNQFGHNHLQEPNTKKKCKFILFTDNDMLVFPQWDEIVTQAWKDVKKHGLKDVKIITQLKGSGIKQSKLIKQKIDGADAKFGKLGGSGFWVVRPNFYTDVGFLDLKPLVGMTKKHDQNYWRQLDKLTNGRGYILGIKKRLFLNIGGVAGSICNAIGYKKATTKSLEKIKFIKADKKIENAPFDEFFKQMKRDGH